MDPITLAKKVLDMSEGELIQVLMQIEMQERDLYELLKEKIEDVI